MGRNVLIAFRRDTAANWTGANPTLAAGEPGFETDTGKVKIGDGTTAWNSLAYIGTSAGVSSVAKSGSTPLTGDVTFSEGANVTLTQSGNDIAIAASGGGGGTTEYDYVEKTTNTSVTNTSAAPDTVIAGNAVTYDGATRVKVEFFSPVGEVPVSGYVLSIDLFEGSTDLGQMTGLFSSAGGTIDMPLYGVRFFTPSAGVHTYSIKGYRGATGGTAIVAGGAGGAGTFMPAWYRITKA